MARKKVSRKRLREAIQLKRGNVSGICSELNISRQTFYNYKNMDDQIDGWVRDARESIVDLAESQLLRHISEVNDGLGDFRAIQFTLQTFGKDRGWSTRTEITGADGASLFGIELPEDVREFLKASGVVESEIESYAVRQFVDIVRQVAVESG